MRCFYHHDRDAVGSCKSCQRGLCPECAVAFDKGLACPERCEVDVRNLIQLIQNNVRLSPVTSDIIQSGRRTAVIAAVFLLVMGSMFVAWGFITPRLAFVSAMGAVFIIYGLLRLTRALRIGIPKDSI